MVHFSNKNIPQISTQLTFSDVVNSWKARWGINRMSYILTPGLYAVGNPDSNSPVLVTANYKLTVDTLRKELQDLNAWILVLDTKGINVWCAAAKGTFATNELVNRIAEVKLAEVVSHKSIIVPQLGAVGISAHEVLKDSGFKVTYGPVRAKDIKEFINAGMKATKEMRTVQFNMIDRLVLTPLELTAAIKPSIIVLLLLFLLNFIGIKHFGIKDLYAYLGALIAGCVLTPVLLPWIPGRAFAFKGWLLGLIMASLFLPGENLLHDLGYLLVFPAMSAFYAMNFTGASTYTSFSGVIKEMQYAVPSIILSICVGVIIL
ncbi:MAG TPA: mercury methylation corrinoid protein HgcA [Candidatus Gastranaerophilales bacterium]|nr:mercury methylation corrinoid protein HgcA [Candidatus Gastranaerophilales bacterium]